MRVRLPSIVEKRPMGAATIHVRRFRRLDLPLCHLPSPAMSLIRRFPLFLLSLASCQLPTGLNAQSGAPSNSAVLDVGSRRELFVDDYLIDRLTGKAGLRLHHPVPKEIVIVHDAVWEGTGTGYHSVFRDGDLYRMYYKAWMLTITPGVGDKTDPHPSSGAYAESDDGIHWRKPSLGLHEFQGSKANNIVFAAEKVGGLTLDPAHLAVFKDDNPRAGLDARYKAIILCKHPSGRGLVPFKSSDGLHWTPMSDRPVITDGAFDSQNLAFWDGARGVYRAYWRYFDRGTPDKPYAGSRSIRTATSRDLITWDKAVDLRYVDSPTEQLYTNQIKPYQRAPHVLIGFPLRYIDRGWSESMRALPEREHREYRASAKQRFGTALTEALLMSSRDGETFKRWNEAFLPPGIEREGTWNYGHHQVGWHLVETKSALEGAPNELSLYSVESYWTGNSSELRRYTLRLDGFVSVYAPMSGGELVTKPFTFSGDRLELNFASSAAGGIQVELQDLSGRPLSGFSLEDCPAIFGDSIERVVTWKIGRDVSSLAGRPVRLRFLLHDAHLYSLKFQ